MASVKEFTERANRIAANANSLGADVTVQVLSDSYSLQVTFRGTDINGKSLKHPLSCGHIHFPLSQLNNEQFLDGMFDAVGAILMGRSLSPMQAIFLPIGAELIEEILSLLSDIGADVSIHIVTEDDIDDEDMPDYIKDMLRNNKRRTQYPRRNDSKDIWN